MSHHSVICDFEEDWRQVLQRLLHTARIPFHVEWSSHELCVRYHDVMTRRLIPVQRVVHRARDLACPSHRQAGLVKLLENVRRGSNLKPWQSTIPWTAVGTDHDDNDSLLRAWAICHFHLGEAITEDGFVTRTPELLFAHVTDTDFYALVIMKHGSWSSQRLFDILQSNWPEIAAPFEIRGVTPESGYTESDVAKLRRGNVNVLTNAPDGTVYAPLGWGKATTGTTIAATIVCDRILVPLRESERRLKEEPSILVKAAVQKGIELPQEIHLQLVVDDGWLSARDDQAEIMFRLFELPRK